jgi:hypothetical protein
MLEDAMNEKAGTRDLDDEDIADEEPIEISSDESDDDSGKPPRVAKKMKGVKVEPVDAPLFVARRPAANRSDNPTRSRTARSGNSAGLDILNNISTAFSPSAQASRDDERAARTLQTTQFLHLSNQIRDANTNMENLRLRLAESERERATAERRADRAEMQLEMTMMSRRANHGRSPYPSPFHHSRSQPSQQEPIRRETRWPDGGGSVTWIRGPSDESDQDRSRSPFERTYTHPDGHVVHTRGGRRPSSPDPPPPSSYPPLGSDNNEPPLPRPVSPFRSAMSGMNRLMETLEPETLGRRVGGSSTAHGSFQVTVAPDDNDDNGVSVVITPRRRRPNSSGAKDLEKDNAQ